MSVYAFRPRERSEHFTELSATPLSWTGTVAQWGQILAALELSDYDMHQDLARVVRHELTHPPRSS